jgi:hypothetical protein
MLIGHRCCPDGREGCVCYRAARPSVTAMPVGEVFVVDRIQTRPGCAREFVDIYLADYAPGARERGMTLRDVLVSPPIWFTDQSNIVIITWVLPSPRAWWEMTWQGRPDPALGEWWASVATLIEERSRAVAAAAGDIEKLCDV